MRSLAMIVMFAATPAAAQPSDPVMAKIAELVPGAQKMKRADDHIVVTAHGAPGDWNALRALGQQVFDEAAKVGTIDGVELWFEDAGMVARAERVAAAGPVHVEVGDGDVMLDDRAVYGLAARTDVTVPTESWGSFTSVAGRPTCAGSVENLGSAEVEVTVRCRIYGDNVSPLGVRQPRAILIDQAVPVGTVAPGAPQKWSVKLAAVEGNKVTLPGQSVVENLRAEVTLEVGGAEVPYLDLKRFDLATDWLRVMDALRADGVTVHSYWPERDEAMRMLFDELELHGPDDLADRPAAARKPLAKKWWKLVNDHYKRFKRKLPRKGVRIEAGGESASLRNGRFGKFE